MLLQVVFKLGQQKPNKNIYRLYFSHTFSDSRVFKEFSTSTDQCFGKVEKYKTEQIIYQYHIFTHKKIGFIDTMHMTISVSSSAHTVE